MVGKSNASDGAPSYVQNMERLATYYKVLANQRSVLEALSLIIEQSWETNDLLRYNSVALFEKVAEEVIATCEMIWTLSGPPDKP